MTLKSVESAPLVRVQANVSAPRAFGLLVLLSVPFSAIGAMWALYLLGYQVSLAVWMG